MKTKRYFGLCFFGDDRFDAKDVAARLFLCPRITPEHALKLLWMLEKGKISIESFIAKTDAYIKEMLADDNDEEGAFVDFEKVLINKRKRWIDVFQEPSASDYEYLEEKYGFSKDSFIGDKEQQLVNISSPKDLSDNIKLYVKGQDEAISRLAVPMFLHLQSARRRTTCKIKSPIVMMGPTGCGKSEILRRCGELCDCPVIRINLSAIAAEGWKATHISDIIAHEVREGVSREDLEYAILVFHEFDKITHYGIARTSERGGEGDFDMMREIMRFFETGYSMHIDVNGGSGMSLLGQDTFKLPVDNLMIVFDGAFYGIESIIKKRLDINKSIGFDQRHDNGYEGMNIQSLVTTEDLIQWGYLPELVGRIGDIVVLNPLSSDVIYDIMVSAKDSVLLSHIEHCMENNIKLHFDEDALRYIASLAYESGLGFRNVKTLLMKVLNSIYFDHLSLVAGTKQVVEINKEYVEQRVDTKLRQK